MRKFILSTNKTTKWIQCKRERHAGLSFLPTFLRRTPGSCSLPVPLSRGFPCPSTSWSLFCSFPLCWTRTLVHHRSFSFTLLPSRFWSLMPTFSILVVLSLCYSIDETRPSSSDSLWSPRSRSSLALLPIYKSLRPFHFSSFSNVLHLSWLVLVFRSMPLRLLQFNLICSSPAVLYGRKIYHTWYTFSIGNCVRQVKIIFLDFFYFSSYYIFFWLKRR